jgi:transcriptional regulator
LLLFQAPNAYISPAWYVVTPSAPTWNYIDVRVRSRLKVYDDADKALETILQTIAMLEGRREQRWQPEPSMDYIRKILPGIMSFQVEVESVDYQFKISIGRVAG